MKKHCALWGIGLAAVLILSAFVLRGLRPATAGPADSTDAPADAKQEEPPAPPPPSPAEQVLKTMTLREKVCQLMMVYPSDITGAEETTVAGETTKQALQTYPVGGFLCDRQNLVSRDQIRTMLTTVQTYSKIPLLLTCDEEGGRVSRLMDTEGTTKIGPMLQFKDQGAEKAEENAATLAKDLRDCGFNMDMAPVADVWSNPQNTVIGDRAYSDDFTQAAELLPGAVRGFHRGGVACTLKHFPGHGDTSADTHYGSAYIYKSLDDLRKQELLPFQAGIDAGADAVMMGHLILADVDGEPALFSHKLVTELLREEMGFQGVILTDGLRMQAMTDHYQSGEIAVRAIQAGVDLLLCPEDLDAAIDALMQAVESGTIPQERLDESVLRILNLKQTWGLLPQ